MIKKTFLGICAFAVLCLVCMSTEAEARHHCRKSTNIQFNVGTGYRTNTYVTRYARPVMVPVLPAYTLPPAYYPVYAPVATYPAPVYVEEVYVRPAPRPFFGLGFSWNFF